MCSYSTVYQYIVFLRYILCPFGSNTVRDSCFKTLKVNALAASKGQQRTAKGIEDGFSSSYWHARLDLNGFDDPSNV